jgi:hypothetical protein
MCAAHLCLHDQRYCLLKVTLRRFTLCQKVVFAQQLELIPIWPFLGQSATQSLERYTAPQAQRPCLIWIIVTGTPAVLCDLRLTRRASLHDASSF